MTAATFDAVFERYVEVKSDLSKGHLKSLRVSYGHWWKPFLGKMKVEDLTLDDVDRFSKRYLAGVNPITKKPHNMGGLAKQLGDLRALVNFAVRYKLANPLDFKIKQPRVQERPVHAMSGDEARHFLVSVGETEMETQQRVAIWVMLWMGLRISEVTSMRWDWFQKEMTYYTPGLTKGKEASLLPVHPVVAEKLQAWRQTSDTFWLRQGMTPPATVFYTRDGGPQYQEFAKKAIRRAAAAVGLGKAWTNHDMRRTCASMLHEAGVPILQIQLMLRHKDIKTTLRYIQKDRGKLMGNVVHAFDHFMGLTFNADQKPAGTEATQPDPVPQP